MRNRDEVIQTLTDELSVFLGISPLEYQKREVIRHYLRMATAIEFDRNNNDKTIENDNRD